MEQQLLMVFFIGIILGTTLSVVVYLLKQEVPKLLNALKDSKKYQEKKKEVEDMKARGEMHDWIEMNVEGNNTLVCAKTGWCPSVQGFINEKDIEWVKRKDELYEEFKKYEEEMYKKIAQKFQVSVDEIKQIDDDLQKEVKKIYKQMSAYIVQEDKKYTND